MALYHYFMVKKEAGRETGIDGIWTTKSPVATMEKYREFKREVSGEKTVADARKWTCVTFNLLSA